MAGSTDYFVDESTDYLQPFADVASRLEDLSDAEVRSLLGHYGPRVNNMCVSIIRRGNRIEFLDQFIEYLNRSPSPVYVTAIESLLKGPNPFREVDPTSRQPQDPLRQVRAYAQSGSVSNRRRTNELIKEGMALAAHPNAANWPKLRGVYTGWLDERGSEWYAIAFAQAMAECDSGRTADFLSNELTRPGHDDQTLVAALGAMGVLANRANLPAVEAFAQSPEGESFQKSTNYRPFYRYALHRCRGLYRWLLVQDADSNYTIFKTE